MWRSRKKSTQAVESKSRVLLCHCVKCASISVLLRDLSFSSQVVSSLTGSSVRNKSLQRSMKHLKLKQIQY